MTVYCVAYDLNKAGQDYNSLHKELKKSPGYWHYLDSTWLIYSHESADELSNRLHAHIDSNDRLLVIKVVRPFSGWLTKEAIEWINNHI